MGTIGGNSITGCSGNFIIGGGLYGMVMGSGSCTTGISYAF